MQHSTTKPTRYEQERIDAMVRLGCIACASLGIPYANVHVHHVLEGGRRMGHYYTIPLCPGHHEGQWTQLQCELIEPDKRVAISDGRKRFNAIYGTERDLWTRIQARLHLPTLWRSSKVLPRRGVTA